MMEPTSKWTARRFWIGNGILAVVGATPVAGALYFAVLYLDDLLDQSPLAPKLVLLLLIPFSWVIGWFWFFGNFFDAKTSMSSRSWPAKSGIIEAYELVEGVDEGDKSCEVFVTYRYSVRGETYHGTSESWEERDWRTKEAAGAWAEQHVTPGNSLQVFFHPSDPTKSTLVRGYRTNPFWIRGVVAMFLAAFGIAAIAMLLQYKPT